MQNKYYFKIFLLSLFIFNPYLNLKAESEQDAFNAQAALTDEQKAASEEYFHQGVFDREYRQKCEMTEDGNLNNKDCYDGENAFKEGIGATLEIAVPVAAKMYSVFFGMGNNKLTYQPKNVRPGQTAGTQEVLDYCSMVPVAVELTTATTTKAFQMQMQKRIDEQKTGIDQLDAIYAVAESHSMRRKMATIQAVGWGTAATCYIAIISQSMATKGVGAFVVEGKQGRQLWMRFGASSILSSFYGLKASQHKKRAKDIREFADSFPKKGDCNPFTNTFCFCSEETSLITDPANHQKVCQPRQYANRDKGFSPIDCVDSHMNPDPNCNCRITNTCVAKNFLEGFNGIPQISSKFNEAGKYLSMLGDGKYNEGNLLANHRNNMAMAKKMFNDLKDKIPNMGDIPPPTSEELELYNQMTNMGVPAELAKVATKMDTSNAKQGNIKNDTNSHDFLPKNVKDKVKKFDHLYGKKSFGTKKSNTNRAASNPFASLLKKNNSKSNSGGVEVMEFAKKAIEGAEIRENTSDSHIFDFISYRYQKSAWPNLNEEEENSN